MPLPDIYACTDWSIPELIEARDTLADHFAWLNIKLNDLRASRSQKQAASLALAAEDVARTAHQIHELAVEISASEIMRDGELSEETSALWDDLEIRERAFEPFPGNGVYLA